MKQTAFIIMLLVFGVLIADASVSLSNLTVSQRTNSTLVDITYDVSNTEAETVQLVSLVVSNGLNEILSPSVSGDVGDDILTGTGKSIIWNAEIDWAGDIALLTFTLRAEHGYPCPISKTGQISSYSTGDDGDLRTGVLWPEPRFVDNGDGTVLDSLTGLEWVKDPQSLAGNASGMNWSNAVSSCFVLEYAGHSDWHLPSRKEFMSLVDYGNKKPPLPPSHPFINILHLYWTSTSGISHDDSENPEDLAWVVGFINYAILGVQYKSTSCYAWPVRNASTASSPAPAPVPRTMQSISYCDGDDGDLEEGIDWPNPRFSDFGDGTVLDSLTGLQWAKTPHSVLGNSGGMNWYAALDFCNSLSLAGETDWRLPNVKELESLFHYGQGVWGSYPNEWLNSSETPISGIHGTYWSSTTWEGSSDSALLVSMAYAGFIGYNIKNYDGYRVWPVRDQASFIDYDMATVFCVTDTRSAWEPNTDLIAFFPFNCSAEDEGGRGHTGTVVGAALTLDRYGNPDSAYSFDGVDDYIFISDHADFTLSNITVAAWIKTTDKSDYKCISSCFGTLTSSQWYNFHITPSTGTASWQVDSGNVDPPPKILGTTDIADGNWHLIAGVRDSASMELRIYVDGILQGSTPDVSTAPLNPEVNFWIGGQNERPLRFFNGIIDDVRIYAKALTSGEVKQLADADFDQLSDADELSLYGTNPILTDSDGDDMPDGWEVLHSMNPVVADGGSDNDHDGLLNREEYIIGTDPNDEQSYRILFLANPGVSSDDFSLKCSTLIGRQYSLEYRNSLLDGDWQSFSNFNGSGGNFFVPDSIGSTQRFYRVVVNVTPNSMLSDYQLIEGRKTWQEAKLDAESRGGHLAVITSAEEWGYVSNKFGASMELAWIGATDERVEGVWEWVTGEQWVFDNWNTGEPNGGSLHDYALTVYAPNDKWSDHPYNSTYVERYILEIPK